MKRSLLLRADASARMGTGHVMRCLALAQAWQDMGGKVALLARELPEALADRVQGEGISLLPWMADQGDAQQTINAAQSADWLVIDGYQFDAVFCDQVIAAAKHTLLVDDLGLLPRYTAELVLNQNITGSEAMYPTRAKGCSLLAGGRYALLRREFRQPLATRDATAPCAAILATLGGSDPDNVTLKVIEALEAIPHLRAKVVVGAANPRREALQGRCKATDGRIEVLPMVKDMVPLMDAADLAVSAGGTSVLELAARGLPTLLIAIADNQLAICETLSERGVMSYAGWHEEVTSAALASTIESLVSPTSQETRRGFAAQGLRMVDGFGASRVAFEMMARSALGQVTVRAATFDDARPVLEWANDPLTRSVSFNQTAITWEQHSAWFVKRLADPSCCLLIGEDPQGAAMGTVRFDVEGQVATISINVAPEHRDRGLGTALILVACRHVLNAETALQVRALIKPDNGASLRAFQRGGFRSAPDVDLAGQRALCMVLD